MIGFLCDLLALSMAIAVIELGLRLTDRGERVLICTPAGGAVGLFIAKTAYDLTVALS